MIVLAILATLAAIAWTVVVLFANGMASSPQDFQGAWGIGLAWIIVAALWAAWLIG